MRFRTAVMFASALTALTLAAAAPPHWVATWGASPAPLLPDPEKRRSEHFVFENQTLREIVHTSMGGSRVRVRLSNAYGKQTLVINSAHLALRSQGAGIVAGSDRPLTFSDRSTVSIPPDALVLSDPVSLDVPVMSDLAISLFVSKPTEGAGIHYSAEQTSYVAPGDNAAAATLSDARAMKSWVFLTGVDVEAPASASTLVAFGDSITDGARSTLDANARWPNFLARRLAEQGPKNIGVLDAGIGGNRILNDPGDTVQFGVNALSRFDRDVLAQPAVKYVIVLEGINDLGHPGTSAPASQTVTAEDIIAGLKQMIDRSHEKGIRVFGATLTPFEGTSMGGYFSPEKEAKRKAVNEWIRTSRAFDGVVDFDKAIRDPAHPDRMLPDYDGGDHLHPGDAGYKAMADAIDLALFK